MTTELTQRKAINQIARISVISVVVVLALVQTNSSAAEKRERGMKIETVVSVPAGQRQLFLDDDGIARMENVKRTLHQPEKKGAVIVGTQTRSAPAWDVARQTYLLATLAGCYESKDGLHWTPIKSNRRVDCVVYDATDPNSAHRYKGALHPDGFVVSPDGANWKQLDVPGVPSGDEYNFSFDEQEHLFILTVKHGGPHGRAVFFSTSRDFRTWTNPELNFHADDLDQKLGRARIERRFADPTFQQPFYNIPATYNVDVYNMGVFRYENLYLGLPSLYDQTGKVAKDWPGFVDGFDTPEMLTHYRRDGDWSGFHHVQLICSRDLHHWQRLGDRQAFLAPSPLGAGAYDTACIIGPSSPVVRGNQLWFYYTGLKQYGGPEPDRDNCAVCLAVLRRDGFISLDASEKEGTILTKPFRVTGNKLFVNADALKGELRVQALDDNRKVLATSAPLNGNLLRGEVQWQQGDIATLKGQTVSLRFTLRSASFYSYWLEGNHRHGTSLSERD